MGALLVEQDGQLVVLAGVAERQAQQEAVELGLGERVGALVVHRVLRRDDEEGLVERVRHAVHGGLPLAHGLQQRRLGAGRGPVDLVGQQDVGEDRPGVEGEAAVLGVEDLGAEDVGGQQVRRELDPGHPHRQGPGQGLGQGGLADAGDVLHQHVAAGQHADDHQIQGLLLAADDAGQGAGEASRQRGGVGRTGHGGSRVRWVQREDSAPGAAQRGRSPCPRLPIAVVDACLAAAGSPR